MDTILAKNVRKFAPVFRYLGCLVVVLLCASCAQPTHLSPGGDTGKKAVTAPPVKAVAKPVEAVPAIDLRSRLLLPEDQMGLPASAAQPLFSFQAKDLPIAQALAMFASSYKLNVIVDPSVTGKITVKFYNVSFDQAMEALLHSLGFYWHRDGNLVLVEAKETRQFTLDYLATKGDNRIWKGLAEKLKVLLTTSGTLVISPLTGTIQVTDKHPNIEAVAQFLNQLRQTIRRQVEIDMKIIEVTLNNDTSLGIDWSRVNLGSLGLHIAFSTVNTVTSPAGGFIAQPASFNASAGYTSKSGKGDINSVISALSEQGNVKIISEPKIRTLNNQPSLVKVGTDRTFITQEVTTTTGTSSISTTGYTKAVVPEGLELKVTPQISVNGWIILDVRPKISRVSSVTEIKDAAGNVLASGPNLDVRETQSMVRVHDGQTAVIGGLIQTVKSDTERHVPLLGDIPLLGNLFKGTYNKDKRTELVIFLTPHLIGPSGKVSGGAR
ncbi:MAG: pilus (MSHA type) biogenesis protein MshL [Mariprofundales bacterium]|nr:pilus (MSHA type) biogenesis protein MshL [Mariprofundales bacterium]